MFNFQDTGKNLILDFKVDNIELLVIWSNCAGVRPWHMTMDAILAKSHRCRWKDQDREREGQTRQRDES